ncbi:pre-mRNA 3'-end-processing factor FIP1 isoform X2 [Astyanax mexicanus]|uniref:pre-mRNA 3'-end-processing factor FIP1 isoform X2 n=1 Tax=Astyanax mexicanus TaxID=7994 RepID=UPI0020CABF9E|nr:pre-mRNA 3'-end-processing factor FIP1 isoform X2 [Astyanax mexicanus]
MVIDSRSAVNRITERSMASAAAAAEEEEESQQVEDEEHWLYGDENSKNPSVNDETREKEEPAEELSADPEDKNEAEQATKSAEDEEEEDSDSDDEDDVKVTIGNIKTGAPAYMGSGINLNIKPVRGYGVTATNKLQCKGVVDLEAPGFNGLHAGEVEADTYEDKPWRKPGADLSDYFNYGFNEETWKAYCEKQRRLQLGLDPCVPPNFENKITVQQGRTVSLEKDPESPAPKLDYKTEFPPQVISASSRLKAGPPPNRKMGGTIDVIGGQMGTIRRVEGRRREIPEQNPIQVLGDHGNKPQPVTPPTAPPPIPIGVPPPHFLHRPPPVSGIPPPMQPPGIPPPALPGIFPPPHVPPPNLMMPPVNSRCPTSGYGSRAPPPFGYSSGEPNFISYPPVSSSHMPWGGVMEKNVGGGVGGHWEHSRRDREREREREAERRERERTPTANEYGEDDRYRYYARESEREYERFHHTRASSRGREEHSGRERRHREKEESGKHKSSKRKQHEDDGDGHRRHKHKKNKRSKEDRAAEDVCGLGDEHEPKD